MMKRIAAGSLATTMAVTVGATGLAATSAQAGNQSLATVLTSDGNKFDRNANDYDIVTQAVLKVLKEKPNSPVSVLTDGSVKLTAFVPNDRAFRALVKDLTGKRYKKERTVYKKVRDLGVDTVETVLLYHVVPGPKINSKAAVKANGAKLKTAQGGIIKVGVKKVHGNTIIKLRDRDFNDRNAKVIVTNINKGNKQLAHGVNRVLRPVDL